MLILKYLSKLFKILQSGASTAQIAGGFILGMILGLTPLWSLHNLVVLILLIIIRVNLSMAIFSLIITSGIAWLLDPFFHSLGFWLLTGIPAIQPMWTSMYNTPVIALTRFNNTVVLGSLVSSLILLLPVFFLIKWSVRLYRDKLDAKIQKLKIVKILKSSKLYRLYEKFKKLGD